MHSIQTLEQPHRRPPEPVQMQSLRDEMADGVASSPQSNIQERDRRHTACQQAFQTSSRPESLDFEQLCILAVWLFSKYEFPLLTPLSS